jgi:hypothetical protein
VLLIDAIYVKIRDGQVANRPVYVVLGINCHGERDVLGMWAGTGGEGAKAAPALPVVSVCGNQNRCPAPAETTMRFFAGWLSGLTARVRRRAGLHRTQPRDRPARRPDQLQDDPPGARGRRAAGTGGPGDPVRLGAGDHVAAMLFGQGSDDSRVWGHGLLRRVTLRRASPGGHHPGCSAPRSHGRGPVTPFACPRPEG